MSRMKRLKNRKSDIKATISGLTLALAIGVTGCLGSYAYFSDFAEIRNDLVVTMGTLITDIGTGFNETIEKNETIKKEFEIKNNGNLEQLVTINFENIDVDQADSSTLKYTLTVDNNTIISTTLDNLGNEELKLDRVLSKGESFNCKSTLTNSGELQVKQGSIEFDLVVTGEQTDANKGSKGGTK